MAMRPQLAVLLCFAVSSVYGQVLYQYATLPKEWISRASVPSPTTYTLRDDSYRSVSLPSAFLFYGVPHTSVYLCSNGFISFASSTSGLTRYRATHLPNSATPNGIVAAMWTDLFPSSSSSIWSGSTASGLFVMSMEHIGSAATFQYVLNFTAHSIQVNYNAVHSSYTAGVEDYLGINGLETHYSTTNHAGLSTARSILYSPQGLANITHMQPGVGVSGSVDRSHPTRYLLSLPSTNAQGEVLGGIVLTLYQPTSHYSYYVKLTAIELTGTAEGTVGYVLGSSSYRVTSDRSGYYKWQRPLSLPLSPTAAQTQFSMIVSYSGSSYSRYNYIVSANAEYTKSIRPNGEPVWLGHSDGTDFVVDLTNVTLSSDSVLELKLYGLYSHTLYWGRSTSSSSFLHSHSYSGGHGMLIVPQVTAKVYYFRRSVPGASTGYNLKVTATVRHCSREGLCNGHGTCSDYFISHSYAFVVDASSSSTQTPPCSCDTGYVLAEETGLCSERLNSTLLVQGHTRHFYGPGTRNYVVPACQRNSTVTVTLSNTYYSSGYCVYLSWDTFPTRYNHDAYSCYQYSHMLTVSLKPNSRPRTSSTTSSTDDLYCLDDDSAHSSRLAYVTVTTPTYSQTRGTLSANVEEHELLVAAGTFNLQKRAYTDGHSTQFIVKAPRSNWLLLQMERSYLSSTVAVHSQSSTGVFSYSECYCSSSTFDCVCVVDLTLSRFTEEFEYFLVDVQVSSYYSNRPFSFDVLYGMTQRSTYCHGNGLLRYSYSRSCSCTLPYYGDGIDSCRNRVEYLPSNVTRTMQVSHSGMYYYLVNVTMGTSVTVHVELEHKAQTYIRVYGRRNYLPTRSSYDVSSQSSTTGLLDYTGYVSTFGQYYVGVFLEGITFAANATVNTGLAPPSVQPGRLVFTKIVYNTADEMLISNVPYHGSAKYRDPKFFVFATTAATSEVKLTIQLEGSSMVSRRHRQMSVAVRYNQHPTLYHYDLYLRTDFSTGKKSITVNRQQGLKTGRYYLDVANLYSSTLTYYSIVAHIKAASDINLEAYNSRDDEWVYAIRKGEPSYPFANRDDAAALAPIPPQVDSVDLRWRSIKGVTYMRTIVRTNTSALKSVKFSTPDTGNVPSERRRQWSITFCCAEPGVANVSVTFANIRDGDGVLYDAITFYMTKYCVWPSTSPTCFGALPPSTPVVDAFCDPGHPSLIPQPSWCRANNPTVHPDRMVEDESENAKLTELNELGYFRCNGGNNGSLYKECNRVSTVATFEMLVESDDDDDFTGIIPQRFVAAALEDQGVVFSDFNNRSVMDVQWCLHGSCTPEMPLTSATAPHSADVVDTVSSMETFPETNKRTASYLYTGQTYGGAVWLAHRSTAGSESVKLDFLCDIGQGTGSHPATQGADVVAVRMFADPDDDATVYLVSMFKLPQPSARGPFGSPCMQGQLPLGLYNTSQVTHRIMYYKLSARSCWHVGTWDVMSAVRPDNAVALEVIEQSGDFTAGPPEVGRIPTKKRKLLLLYDRHDIALLGLPLPIDATQNTFHVCAAVSDPRTRIYHIPDSEPDRLVGALILPDHDVSGGRYASQLLRVILVFPSRFLEAPLIEYGDFDFQCLGSVSPTNPHPELNPNVTGSLACGAGGTCPLGSSQGTFCTTRNFKAFSLPDEESDIEAVQTRYMYYPPDVTAQYAGIPNPERSHHVLYFSHSGGTLSEYGIQQNSSHPDTRLVFAFLNRQRLRGRLTALYVSPNAQHMFATVSRQVWELQSSERYSEICDSLHDGSNKTIFLEPFRGYCANFTASKSSINDFVDFYTLCPPGTYCPSLSNTHSQRVRPGSHSAYPPLKLPCPRGHYCTSGIPEKCPVGHYCPQEGMKSPLACPDNPLFNTTCFATGLDAVQPCPNGTVCLTVASQPVFAPPGFYVTSRGRRSIMAPCPRGDYCPLAAYEGGNHSCPSGTYCALSRVLTPEFCTAGDFCQASSTSASPCPAGHYCPTPLEKYACKLTQYCSEGSIFPEVCPAGYYCPSPDQRIICPSSHFCKAGVIAPTECVILTSCPQGSSSESKSFSGLAVDVFLCFLVVGLYYAHQLYRKRKRQKQEEKQRARQRRRAAKAGRVERRSAADRSNGDVSVSLSPSAGVDETDDDEGDFDAPVGRTRAHSDQRKPFSLRDFLVRQQSRGKVDSGRATLVGTADSSSSPKPKASLEMGFIGATKKESGADVSALENPNYAPMDEKSVELTDAGYASLDNPEEEELDEEDGAGLLPTMTQKDYPIEFTLDNVGLVLEEKWLCGQVKPPGPFAAPPLRILDGVNATIGAGKVTAIMGPSGCGKTTLLTILSGRRAPTSGTVLINGAATDNQNLPRSLMGYVPQDDIMLPTLTVHETISFAAKMRLPKSLSVQHRVSFVEDVITVLGLQKVKHSIIGDASKRGLSGGQRKRVNIGIEIAADPTVLFLDEPTSGLDSSSSQEVMTCLQYMASLGMTVVVVIHQPRYEIFAALDDVILLGPSGSVRYAGAADRALPHFERQGFRCPERTNPADFIIDILAGKVSRSEEADIGDEQHNQLAQDDGKDAPLAKQSAVAQDEMGGRSRSGSRAGLLAGPAPGASLEELEKHKHSSSYGARNKAGFLLQMWHCAVRYMVQQTREGPQLLLDYGLIMLAGCVVGAVFMNSHYEGPVIADLQEQCPEFLKETCSLPRADPLVVQNAMTCLGVCLTALMASLRVFGNERLTIWREANAGHSAGAYYVAKLLLHLPHVFIGPFVFLSMYFTIVTPRGTFAEYYMILLLVQFACSGMGYMVSTFFKPTSAQLTAVVGALVLTVLGGASPTLLELRGLSQPLPFLVNFSYARWAIEALYIAEIKQYRDVYDVETGLRKVWGYSFEDYDTTLVMLLVIGVASRLLAFVGLKQMISARTS